MANRIFIDVLSVYLLVCIKAHTVISVFASLFKKNSSFDPYQIPTLVVHTNFVFVFTIN